MSTPISPPSPTRMPEEIELPEFVNMPMPAPALNIPAVESNRSASESSSSSSNPASSTDSSSQQGSSPNVPLSTERRAGGMSQASLHAPTGSASGTGTGTGIKTPRKNVQWAASTKGEGPMGAAELAHSPHPAYHRAGPPSRQLDNPNAVVPSASEIRHMHLLDEEGLDPKAFQTLTHALERHQSSSHENSPSQSHTTLRRDFADHNSNSNMTVDHHPGSSAGPSSRPQLGSRRTEPPRLSSLPPNPFSDANRVSTSSNLNEIFTPTTLSPIHSDAGTETSELTPERSMPGEAVIESTEQYGLPRPLPASALNNATDGLKSSASGGGLASRFSRFPFRSSSKDNYPTTSSSAADSGGGGGRVGDGALGSFTALDAEEEEKRRVERRASKLVRAHTRGFQFLAGFKGNRALQRLAPEDIDADAPLPRRPTRFSHSAAVERKRSRSAPASNEIKEDAEITEKSRDSSIDKDENQAGSERRGLFSFRRRSHSRTRSESHQREDEDVENTATYKQSSHHAPLALGSGVLSALLTLYDRPAGGARSGFTTPGDRTPSGSEPASPESEGGFPAYSPFAYGKRKDREREKEKEEKGDYFGKHASARGEKDRVHDEDERRRDELQRINTRLNSGSMIDSEHERERFEHERSRERSQERKIGLESGSGSKSGSSAELTPPQPLYAQRAGTRSLQSLKIKSSFSDLTRTMSGGIERIKEKTSPTRLTALPMPRIPVLGDSLPSGARSGAGVFGSLIASTGNLTGVAAPAASRIGPNPKKPGFHLNRYSWSEEGATPEAEEALRRIKNANKSLARTPGNTARTSASMNWTRSEPGFFGAAASGSDPTLALGMSRSAPTTPAGEVPPSIIDVIANATPSPASDVSETPLMGASKAVLSFGDSPPLPTLGHAQSNSLDSTAPLLGDRFGVGGHSRTHSDTLSLTTIPTRGSAATSMTLNNNSTGASTPGVARRKWAGILKDFQKSSMNGSNSEMMPTRSGAGTPDTMSDAGSHDYWDEKNRVRAEEKRKRKRKKAEIYITRHVAEIMQRQEFILKLARAFMMFGAPSHRLPAQIQATARVLEMELSCMYLPDVMLISFDDAATSTSNIKFIRQGAALSLGKLQDAYDLYWKVIHDEVGVGEASRALDALMQQKPPYSTWQLALFGGFCSAAICQVSFSGSFIDCLIAFPLGVFLVFVQIMSVRNELYSNVFEITITTLLSFLSAVFAGTHHFCYSAVASGSIVLILPGFLVLNGSLELSSRNIVSGAVRLGYAVMYALFLGFGLSIGGTLYEKFTGNPVADPEDYTCGSSHHADGPWYQRTPGGQWAFLTVPMFSLFLSLRNQAPWRKKELIVTVIISCIGWTCNHFSALKFPNRNDVSSAIGAFAVGFIANLYGRFFSGNAFVIMITGILFQLPSGLGNGGLITFASQNNTSGTSTSYLSGFRTASQLISVSVGLTVGLGISLVVIFPIQSRKRAGGIFSL
ncbi:PRM10_1 [Sanghuangporus weigelae]